jgi:type I restriction enzyme R subunit
VGEEVGEAADLVRLLAGQLDDLALDYDWRGKLAAQWKYVKVTTGLANHLRASRPAVGPGDSDETAESTADRFHLLSTQLVRAWALASGSDPLADAHPVVRFYEEVRVYMAKFDAEEREPVGGRSPKTSSDC